MFITGYVTDLSGVPLTGARVHIKDSPHVVTSVEHGAWWRPLPAMPHVMRVDMEGYYSDTKLVQVVHGNTVMFELEKDDRVLSLPRMVFVLLVGGYERYGVRDACKVKRFSDHLQCF